MRDMSLFISVTWLIYMCDTTHSYVWYHFFFGLIYKCAMTVPGDVWHVSIHKCNLTHLHVWHDSFVRVISPFFFGLIYMCAMTVPGDVWHVSIIHECDLSHLHVWRDSFVRVISPFFLMCDMTQSYLWTRLAAANISKSHVCLLVSTFCALLLVTRLIHTCDTWHDSFICVTWLIYKCDMALFVTWLLKYQYVMPHGDMTYVSHIWMSLCDMTYFYTWTWLFAV